MKAKKWVIGKKFDGVPTDENLSLLEEDLPELQKGGMHWGYVYLSTDLRAIYIVDIIPYHLEITPH